MKIWGLAYLVSLALIVPQLATWLYPGLAQSLELTSGLTQGVVPGIFALLLATPAYVLAFFARPGLLKRYLSGSAGLRLTLRAVILWSALGTLLWLALVFFWGELALLDRTFAATQAAIMAALLLAGGFLIGWPVLRTAMLAVLAGLALVLWVTESGSAVFVLSEHLARIDHVLGLMIARPLIVPTTFLVATIAAYVVVTAWWLRGVTRTAGIMIGLAGWIAAAHLVWLLMLFTLGAADIPRWLPILTASIMGLVIFAVPIGGFLARKQDLFARYIEPERLREPGVTATVVDGVRLVGRRTAWVISYTPVANEPRVLRQCEALVANGWNVVVSGYDGPSPRPREWTFVRLPNQDPYSTVGCLRAQTLRRLAKLLLAYARPPRPAFERLALVAYGTHLSWRYLRAELGRVARERPDLKADLVIAHDYHTAPTGYDVARIYGAKFSVDVHEYAREQYANDPLWVKWRRPMIVGVQDYCLRRADNITVVCEGIGHLLERDTVLGTKPVVIRNVPFLNAQPFRPVGKRVRVLYHGDLSRPRQLHVAIEAMRRWNPHFDLILRGAGDPTYIGELKRAVRRYGLEKRVFFEPPVNFREIVPVANLADIGFFSYEAYSPQIRFALPNKLFEYIMAGLAVCTSDLEEVGRIVRQYGVGKLIPQHTPESIAETINSFTHDDIEKCKKASIAAAAHLNWEAERCRLLDAYGALFKETEEAVPENADVAYPARVGREFHEPARVA